MSRFQLFGLFPIGRRSHPGRRRPEPVRCPRTVLQVEALESRHLLNAGSVLGPLVPPVAADGGDTGTGLRAEYFSRPDLTHRALTRVDGAIHFDWAGSAPDPLLPAHDFSVRWTGRVRPSYSDTYTFSTVSDDGVRLWVNHQLLIDHWTDHPAREDRGTIALTAGRKYDVTMEYYENGIGPAVAELFWSSARQVKEIIPQSALFVPSVPASLSGHVQLDSGDGGLAPTSPGIAGVTVTLSGADEEGRAVSDTIATDADGSYRFFGLRPGAYTVTAHPPAGYVSASNTLGNLGGTAARDQFFIVLGEGAEGRDYNFGEQLASPSAALGSVPRQAGPMLSPTAAVKPPAAAMDAKVLPPAAMDAKPLPLVGRAALLPLAPPPATPSLPAWQDIRVLTSPPPVGVSPGPGAVGPTNAPREGPPSVRGVRGEADPVVGPGHSELSTDTDDSSEETSDLQSSILGPLTRSERAVGELTDAAPLDGPAVDDFFIAVGRSAAKGVDFAEYCLPPTASTADRPRVVNRPEVPGTRLWIAALWLMTTGLAAAFEADDEAGRTTRAFVGNQGKE